MFEIIHENNQMQMKSSVKQKQWNLYPLKDNASVEITYFQF